MQIQIQTSPFKVNESVIEKVTRKLSELSKINEHIEKCNVILKKENHDDNKNFKVEVHLAIPKLDLFASEEAESYGRATHRVIADLKKQLIKNKK